MIQFQIPPSSVLFLPEINEPQILSWLSTVDSAIYRTKTSLSNLLNHAIRLQADGGESRYVTSVKDILSIYWDIAPHEVGVLEVVLYVQKNYFFTCIHRLLFYHD